MYYGWKIVAALFVILIFTSGLGFYNHSVMLQALVSDKGISVTASSTAVSIFFLSSGITGMLIAPLLEKHDVRLVIICGALFAAASLATIRYIETDLQLYATYVLFGIGFCGSSLLPATTLVTRWFERRRASAMSLASTGLSVGGILITPASALLIERISINSASLVFAGIYLVGVIPFCVVLKSRPSDMGLKIDGESLAAGEQAPLLTGVPFNRVISLWYFWGMTIAFMFLMLAQVGGIAHQYGIVGQYLSGEEAALALGVIPVFSILGRLAGGVLLDRYPVRAFALIMMALQAIALSGLGLSASPGGFLISLALFGITIGNLLMLQPLLIAAAYGQLNYSRIYSLSNLLTTIGIATGPLMIGIFYSSLGNYNAAYLAASGASIVGFCFYLSCRLSEDR